MSNPKKCLQCGVTLPAEAVGEYCSQCRTKPAGLDEKKPKPVAKTIVLNFPDLSPGENAGDRIGHYKLLQVLGEGGMGSVWMAEQSEPVRRQVALKVIKLGMDTKEVIARFEAERQALALMDHPNIAKVLDAGTTGNGRPYFVMELVQGVPITEYCDRHNLPTKARLELFARVCHAVQHAHQKGIIHRDIKPSNILVTLQDNVPVPKVIDFGIAKATGQQRLTDKTLFTAMGAFMGTPAYMSPEQAEMVGMDIDTRTDIYALGVLLYELLTGKTPFEAKDLIRAGLDEMRRIIREQEPVRPSTKISTLEAAEQTKIARCRQAEPPRLAHHVRGDLDWIVMKCLEKDRTRRYETANGLAMDLQRHLNNEPVTASPPSNLYRFQKMVKRHKLAFVVAGFVMAVLIGSLTVLIVGLTKQKVARQVQATVGMLQDELLYNHEIYSQEKVQDGRKISVEEALGRAMIKLEPKLTNYLIGQAKFRETLAITYHALGFYNEAITLQQKSLDYYLANYGQKNDFTISSMQLLAAYYDDAGQPQQAIKLGEKVLALCRKVLGSKHPETVVAMNRLVFYYRQVGQVEAGLKLQEEALKLSRKLSGPQDTVDMLVMASLANLAIGYDQAGRREDAFKLREELLHFYRKAADQGNVWGENNLGNCYEHGYGVATNAVEAAKWYRKAAEQGNDQAENHLGWMYQNGLGVTNDSVEAVKWFRQAAEQGNADGQVNLGLAYEKGEGLPKDLTEASKWYRKAAEQNDSSAQDNLGYMYENGSGVKRDIVEAVNWFRKAADQGNADALNALAWILATSSDLKLNDGPAAVRYAEKAAAMSQRQDPNVLDTLAAAYAETGQFTNAVELEAEAIAAEKDENNRKAYTSRLELYKTNKPFRDAK